MKMFTPGKNRIFSLLVLVLILTATCSGTLAYITVTTGPIVNTFVPGSLPAEPSTEPPTQPPTEPVHPDSPPSGDSSHVAVYLAVMIVSLALLFLLLLIGKRRKKDR